MRTDLDNVSQQEVLPANHPEKSKNEARVSAHIFKNMGFSVWHYLNPYLNYRRPCFFPVVTVDKEGKQRKRYPYKAMMTPYEKLKSLPQATQYLKPGESFEHLDAYALGMSDNEAASKLSEARKKLFQTIFEQNAA